MLGPAMTARNYFCFPAPDLWRDGRFMHGGLQWSRGGLDCEGFTPQRMAFGRAVPLPLSGTRNNDWVIGAEEQAQLLPSWRFKRDRLELKVFAGLDIKNDVTRPHDPSNRLHGTSVGARAAVN